MVSMPASRISDGITAAPSIRRQFPDGASAALTQKATRMPTVIMSWLSDVIEPRISVGASSERYSGTTSAEQPTARPSTNRAASSTPTVGASADTSAPTVKVTAAMMSRRRPSRSDRRPASAAPTIAPSSRQETIAPSTNEDVWKCWVMKRMAPEMTPVS